MPDNSPEAQAPVDEKLVQRLKDVLVKVEHLLYQGKLSDASDLLDENKRVFMKSHVELYTGYLLQTGWLHIRRRRVSEAEEAFEEASKIIEEYPKGDPVWDRMRQAKLWGESRTKRILGNDTKADQLLGQALRIRKTQDEITARVLGDLAIINAEQGDHKTAIDNYLKAIFILEKTNDKLELARNYNNIADAYLKNEEWENALEYAKKTAAVSQEIENPRIEGYGRLNAGEALLKMGDSKKARIYHEICLDVFSHTQQKHDLGYCFYLGGMIETADGNYDKAEDYFTESLEILDMSDHRFQTARIFHEYGVLLLKKGEIEEAKEMLKKSAVILEEYNCFIELKRVQEKLDEIDGTGEEETVEE
jgi:tetratricopeptide (TPR) repeat protein